VIAAEGAGVRFRDDHDLRRGTALAWDITGELWRDRPADWQPTSPTVAGQHLAALLHEHNLVLFECFLPDLAGHGRLGNAPQVEQIHMVFQRIDALLGGVLATLRPEDTLLISSDHGNVESLHAVTHTRNPVPLLAVGAQATAFRAVQAIDGIAAIVEQVAMR
jgi:2,3-bisphosphoglycerate-independent phosphoglycerate mutase